MHDDDIIQPWTDFSDDSYVVLHDVDLRFKDCYMAAHEHIPTTSLFPPRLPVPKPIKKRLAKIPKSVNGQ